MPYLFLLGQEIAWELIISICEFLLHANITDMHSDPTHLARSLLSTPDSEKRMCEVRALNAIK